MEISLNTCHRKYNGSIVKGITLTEPYYSFSKAIFSAFWEIWEMHA